MTNEETISNDIKATFENVIVEYNRILEDVLNRIGIEEIRSFVREVLAAHAPTSIDELAPRNNAVEKAQYLIYYLKARQMYNDINPNKQTDTAIAAMLLHNLYFDGSKEHWQDVFTARTELQPMVAKYTTQASYGAFDYIFQIIEAQLGEDMPIPACRPVYGQVTYIVWEVIWFYSHQFKNIIDSIYADQENYNKIHKPLLIEADDESEKI